MPPSTHPRHEHDILTNRSTYKHSDSKFHWATRPQVTKMTMKTWHKGKSTVPECFFFSFSLSRAMQCSAERGIATASCLSVTVRYRDHIGRNSSKTILWLISLCVRSLQIPTTRIYSKGTPKILVGIGVEWTTSGIVFLVIYSFIFTSAFTQCSDTIREWEFSVESKW